MLQGFRQKCEIRFKTDCLYAAHHFAIPYGCWVSVEFETGLYEHPVCPVDRGDGFDEWNALQRQGFFDKVGCDSQPAKPRVYNYAGDVPDFFAEEFQPVAEMVRLVEKAVRWLCTRSQLRKRHAVNDYCDGVREGFGVGIPRSGFVKAGGSCYFSRAVMIPLKFAVVGHCRICCFEDVGDDFIHNRYAFAC